MARPRRRVGSLTAELTSFVGRRRQLGEVRSRLGTARLVSLVGPGGVGKTRLALRSAGELDRGFKDGAWLAELGEVRDGAHVAKVVMTANKAEKTVLYRHTGYPGGIRSQTYRELIDKKPEEAVRRAVRGMLPKGTLGRQQLRKLKVYAGPTHPHAAQMPQPLDVAGARRAS